MKFQKLIVLFAGMSLIASACGPTKRFKTQKSEEPGITTPVEKSGDKRKATESQLAEAAAMHSLSMEGSVARGTWASEINESDNGTLDLGDGAERNAQGNVLRNDNIGYTAPLVNALKETFYEKNLSCKKRQAIANNDFQKMSGVFVGKNGKQGLHLFSHQTGMGKTENLTIGYSSKSTHLKAVAGTFSFDTFSKSIEELNKVNASDVEVIDRSEVLNIADVVEKSEVIQNEIEEKMKPTMERLNEAPSYVKVYNDGMIEVFVTSIILQDKVVRDRKFYSVVAIITNNLVNEEVAVRTVPGVSLHALLSQSKDSTRYNNNAYEGQSSEAEECVIKKNEDKVVEEKSTVELAVMSQEKVVE